MMIGRIRLGIPRAGTGDSGTARGIAGRSATVRYGDVDGYLTRGLGLSPAGVAALRAKLIA